jgi:hypothetical protein
LLCENRLCIGPFAELGREADGTVVDLGGKGELWDAFDELVGVGQTASVAVGKVLMPKDALGVAGQVKNAEDLVGMGVRHDVGCFVRLVKEGVTAGRQDRGGIQRVG